MLRLTDRHNAGVLVVVPGWAFDFRIFAAMDLPYDCFVFDNPSMSALADDVQALMATQAVQKVSLLGWSKGAFAACDFACRHQNWIDELWLVGTRRRYDKDELATMRENLLKNRTACLKAFYRQCFAKEEAESYRRFKATLQDDYLASMSTERLIDDLDWLGRVEIRPHDLQGIEEVKFIHGTADAVAPVDGVRQLAEQLPQAELVLFERAGHLPFLRDDFARRVHEH